MLYGAKEHRLVLDSLKMDYLTFGSGERPLVLIQGLNTRGIQGSAAMLAYMYRIFAKRYRVYLFDRRTDLNETVTVRELACDLAAAMDALGIVDADVFGVSQGGMIAQYLAIDRPDLVRKLVLAMTLCRNNETVETVISNWILLTEQKAWKALVADMAEKMYSDSYMGRYRWVMPLLTFLQKPRDIPRFLTLAKSCLTCNTYGELSRIQCPVLVMGGGKDRIVGAEAAEELAGELGCAKHIYEDLGHAAYEEARDFNRIVYAFLQT